MVNHYEVYVIFKDIEHQLQENILHYSLHHQSIKPSLNREESSIHLNLFAGSFCDIVQPCKLFTSSI